MEIVKCGGEGIYGGGCGVVRKYGNGDIIMEMFDVSIRCGGGKS